MNPPRGNLRFFHRIERPIEPGALKFRKYRTLYRSDMDLLYSKDIDPITMRIAIKKFLKTRLISFKTAQSYWLSHAGYICSHIRSLIRSLTRDSGYEPFSRMTNKKSLNNFLKRCKNLESLKFYTEKGSQTVLRSIRYLQQLKSLHLVLDGDLIRRNLNMVRYLHRLRYITIKLKKSYENSSIATFCEHLLKSKSLEKIELDLQELSNLDHFQLESVLQCISKTNIDFTLRFCLMKTTLNINNISCILSKIDTLVLQSRNDWEDELDAYTKLRSEQSRIIQHGHRVLHFIFKGLDEWDFVSVIESCSSLQALWIEAVRDRDLMLKQFSFPKTLKNIFLVLPYLPIREAKRFISHLTSALNDVETLETLLLALPLQESLGQIDKLKDLKCIRNSTKYHLTVCSVLDSLAKQIGENLLISLCSPITTMSSLKSLKLDFERSMAAPFECIQRVLDSLPSTLKQFELAISAYSDPNPRKFVLRFPFAKLSQLAEFRLDLCYPLSPYAIYQFAKEFVKMKELEVMVVKGACFLDPQFKLQNIVDGLKQMTKIRDVQVSTEEYKFFRFKGSVKEIQEREAGLKNWQIRSITNW